MDELNQVISAAAAGDPNVIKGVIVSGAVTVSVLIGNAVVKLLFKGLKALAKKTATTWDDDLLAEAEKDFAAKAPKK